MKGIICKEYLTYLRTTKPITKLISIAMYLCIMLFFRNMNGLTLTVLLSIPLGCCSLPTTLREQDERVKGNRFMISLPFQKKDLVKGRFMFMFIYILQEMSIGLVFTLLYYMLYQNAPLHTHLLLWFFGLCFAIILCSINLIGSYSLNLTGVAVMYLISLTVALLFYIIPLLLGFDFTILLTFHMYTWAIIGIISLLIISTLSYKASVIMFERNQ